MPSGITGASLTSFVNGTTEDGPTVYQNDLNLKTNGVNNDGGLITTDGAGGLTVVKLALTLGSFTRISKFGTFAVINGKTTVAHGLGAVPDFVIVLFALTGTPSAATIGYDTTTLTSTNVDVWASIAANAIGLAIKF